MKHKIGTFVLFTLLILTIVALKQVDTANPAAPTAIGIADTSR